MYGVIRKSFQIVNRANEMRRDGLLLSVWTLDGKIFVKTSPNGSPIRINELEDLEAIWSKQHLWRIDREQRIIFEKFNWGQRRTEALKEKDSALLYLVIYFFNCFCLFLCRWVFVCVPGWIYIFFVYLH